MKTLILSLCVFCSASLPTLAQDIPGKKPTLTGSIIAVTPRINQYGAKPLFVYQIRLNLLLRNDTAERLVLFRPSLELMSRRIEFVDGYGDTVKPAPWLVPVEVKMAESQKRNSPRPLPSAFPDNQYDLFARSLDSPNPSQSNLLKLEPGAFFEFSEVLTIEDGYKLEINPGQGIQEVATNSPIAVFPGLRIQYRLSLKNHHANDGLLRMLQVRWKKFGHLVLDDAGDFWMRSEVMFNREGL